MSALKSLAAVALSVGMLIAGPSVAATVTLADGGTINPVSASDVYLYEEVLDGIGGASSRSFTFVLDSSEAPLQMNGAAAHLTLVGNMVGAFLSWFDGTATNKVFLTPTPLGAGAAYVGDLSTLFTSPDKLVQTATIGWDSFTGPIQLSLQIAAVPLPAGGLLLIGAIAGLGALRRRKTA